MATSGDRVRIAVLGPIRAIDSGGADITPSGTLPRRLLALLALGRGHVVSVDAAIEVLWPAHLPQDPVAALQNHVFRLRRGLPDGVIESLGDGYRLDASRVDVDADRLAEALADPAPAELEAMLDRWHGPAYPELADVDDARAEALRLEELRTRAQEVCAEARLAAGTLDGLVADLTALADAQPLRERPRALLMSALAATGRHVEALRVYDDFRRLLGDELGTEPSPALAAQHAELLSGSVSTSWSPATRLPVAASSLLGRDALAHDITALAAAQRLVTLVGPGGVGKTRLLLEIGRRLLAERPDRPVVLCELAAGDTATAVDVVAAAVAVDARPGIPLADRLAAVLADTEIVLLLDNCEHVLEPVSHLVDLLVTRCPQLRVVATSRERLRLAGEHVRQVPPLPTGDEHAPAVALFVERARAVSPGFDPDAGQLARIAEIARRLDGLPLAIELAAARLHTHDIDEIASGLGERFSLLSSGFRTSTRHGSLGAAVSWSFELLDDDLQRTFADLSMFAGTFDAADAAAVCGLDAESAAGTLAQLVERSLVMRDPQRRYLLLETLRAFASDQLTAARRADDVALRHARHFVDWIERAERRLGDPRERMIAQIDAAVPELRNALGRLLDHDEIELAGRLVSALIDYSFLRLRPDVLVWAERVIAADPDDRSPCAPQVWVAAAYASWMAGDIEATSARADRALRIAERAGGAIPPHVMEILGSAALFEGRLDDAAAWYLRSADAAGPSDPSYRQFGMASAVMALGYAGDPLATELADSLLAEVGVAPTPHAAYAWYCAGEADLAFDVERAGSRLTQAIHLAELTHTSVVTGIAGATKASIDARIGDPVAAAHRYRQLLEHWRRAGMWSTQWTMLRSVAGLLARLGRFHDAAVLEGAVRGTDAGHRIFGADEIALAELSARLREVLGAEAYDAARAHGAVLDGDAAVEHALRAL